MKESDVMAPLISNDRTNDKFKWHFMKLEPNVAMNWIDVGGNRL